MPPVSGKAVYHVPGLKSLIGPVNFEPSLYPRSCFAHVVSS